MTVSTSIKRLSSKATISIREKIPSPIAGMKDSFKIKLPLDRKKAFPAGVSEKIYKKWFVLARKYVSTTQDEAFVEKYVSLIPKSCFFLQENQRKLFSLTGKCFSFKTGSP